MEWGSLLGIGVWRCSWGQETKSDTKSYEVNSAKPLLENLVNEEQRRKRMKIFDLQRRRKAKKDRRTIFDLRRRKAKKEKEENI